MLFKEEEEPREGFVLKEECIYINFLIDEK